MNFKYFFWSFFLFFNINNQKSIGFNPVTVYIQTLLEIFNTNPINIPTKSAYLYFIKDKLISPGIVQLFLDYMIYNDKNKKNINIKKLLGDLYEFNNRQLILDETQVKKLLKTPSIFKQYIAMENELKFNENPQNTMEILLNNYYFSIYTQKFFISYILLSFINKENSEKIHGLVNFFENNYPSNKKLLFLKILTLISYYESISPMLFQQDWNLFHTIFYLIDEIKNLDIKKKYFAIIYLLETNVKYIQYEKEIYKAKTLINNGQIGVGINIYKRQLEKYNKLINCDLEDYSLKNYNNLNKPSNKLLNGSLFLDNTKEKLFHKIFKQLNYGFLKMNPEIYDINNDLSFKDKFILLDMKKEAIKQNKFYKKYQLHLKKYNRLLKKIKLKKY